MENPWIEIFRRSPEAARQAVELIRLLQAIDSRLKAKPQMASDIANP